MVLTFLVSNYHIISIYEACPESKDTSRVDR